MYADIVSNPATPVNPSPQPLTVDEYLAALAAINAAFLADCAALKARYPGKRRTWPPEAHRDAQAIQDRYDAALDALWTSYDGEATS